MPVAFALTRCQTGEGFGAWHEETWWTAEKKKGDGR